MKVAAKRGPVTHKVILRTKRTLERRKEMTGAQGIAIPEEPKRDPETEQPKYQNQKKEDKKTTDEWEKEKEQPSPQN